MNYTGHALVDAGVATLTTYFGYSRPEELCPDDFDQWAALSLRLYETETGKLSLNQLFTQNFVYTQPPRTPAQRLSGLKSVLYAWRDGPEGRIPCLFCGRPALVVRAHRDLLPLLEGRERRNFGPGGSPGVDLCGQCLLAVQALVFGAPVAFGRVVVLETADDALREDFYRRTVKAGIEAAERSRLTGEKVGTDLGPLSLVVQLLAEIAQDRMDAIDARAQGVGGVVPGTPAATVYAFTNSGQEPKLDVHVLPSSVMRWVYRVQGRRLRDTWNCLRNQAQSRHKDAWGRAIAELPDGLGRFLHQHVFPWSRRLREAELPKGPPLRLFEWVETLLEEVVGMDSDRLVAIKRIGGELAQEVVRHGEVRVFREIFLRNVRYYNEMRRLLLRTNLRRIRRGEPPLLGVDDFVTVFDEGLDETPRVDWRLAWDLITLAVAQSLYDEGWFEGHRDLLIESESAEDESDDDAEAGN